MRNITLATVFLVAGSTAMAGQAPHIGPIQALLDGGLRSQIVTDEVIAAVIAQNATTEALAQSEVDALDAKWREEVQAGGGALVDDVMGAAISDHLRAVQAQHDGLISEVFVMDARGLVVGESDVTSDYWQGDEAKWSETYPVGADAVFIDEIEFDESAQAMLSQVSFTVSDPASGAPVGAVTVGVNVDLLLQ